MKLGAMAGGVCRICGSDTLGADIGCGCMRMYERAKYILIKERFSLEFYWCIQADETMKVFCKLYTERLEKHGGDIQKSFRTDFNRSFYPSVFKQWNETHRVSRKQLEIVQRFIGDPYLLRAISDEVKKQEDFLRELPCSYDRELVDITRNLWKATHKKAGAGAPAEN